MVDNHPDTPSGAQANADVGDARLEEGKAYDKGREQAAKDREADGKEIGDSRSLTGGAVVSGTAPLTSTDTLFPGAVERFDDVEEANQGGVAARAAKGLATDTVTAADTSWTAQSALPYVDDNSANVPGQTYHLSELPDPRVVDASSLPGHAIAAHLVVDDVVQDDINSSQEGGDVGTSPRHAGDAPQAADPARATGGRAAGRSQAKNR